MIYTPPHHFHKTTTHRPRVQRGAQGTAPLRDPGCARKVDMFRKR